MSTIPLSKPTKNLSRDLSDAVIMAEILKIYYPRYVDLHNYVPANSITTKKENWQILNRKVLRKIDMKLTKDIINQLANCYPGAAENMLLELRKKVLQGSDDLLRNDKENDSIEDDKIDVDNIKTTISEKSISSTVDEVTLKTLDLENVTKASRTQTTSENINEDDPNVFHAFVELTRKLQELDNIISSLNHKIAYLENTIKP
ncbi:Sperm flagellar protein 1 [Eufriesea mexicana]|uniref:Sperm flagellar protein 1 n=2 Tax=Eufriesea mexicana TaxID=516756 RepID=A0A310SFP5_9HYME|nr:Sperm flagellar protein 1 [Eufriesea mexicana]